MASTAGSRYAVIVGGGFAALGYVRGFAGREEVAVTVLGRSGHRQFRPLLSHVATSPLTPSNGEEWTGDALVLAAGSPPKFSGTHGASTRPSVGLRPGLRIAMERL